MMKGKESKEKAEGEERPAADRYGLVNGKET